MGSGRTGVADMDRTGLKQHLPSLPFVAAIAILLGLGAAAFIYLGVYNIAADEPHTPFVYSVLERLRDQSIKVHAQGISPPGDLASPLRISTGAVCMRKCVPAVI
jgi:hypothetical protein